ncbi:MULTISPECIES: TetR/AcrR family transcriptional regulator [Streptomyces]|uniref:TetR/AcrR family transcriptional regulator n=1 Tax=Streptomyces TaxID=1883 RepID=UPI001CB79E20|nr:TetR/AcrR family transcriptional regulator [Streptomyces xanthii]
MSNTDEPSSPQPPVPPEITDAALRVAAARGVPVADVTLREIAHEADISRSTLMRRLGGTRSALEEALRAAGIEPGTQKPVRERAIDAAATLISEQGLVMVTFERVAAAAGCSVHSLYAAFGGRDELLHAVFERYSPVVDVEELLKGPRADLETTVRRVYGLFVTALDREPRVLAAFFAEVFARPGADPGIHALFQRIFPRMLGAVGTWLDDEVTAGRVRDLPRILLIQQMTSPIVLHYLLRPSFAQLPDVELPPQQVAIETFTQTFLRAVRTD